MPENLLKNAGFEGEAWRQTHVGQAYGEISVPEEWVAFWKEGPPVPHDPSNTTGYGRPEMKLIPKAPPFLDPLRVRSGEQAVLYFTFWRIHDAGLYQQVSGVQPGTRLRGTGWAHAWSSQNDDPDTSDTSGDSYLNFTFRVGIDPHGGTDPWAESVVWGEGAHIYDEFKQLPPVEVVAQATQVTFFVRSEVLWPFKHCDAYLDDMSLTVTSAPPPREVTITLPDEVTACQPFDVVATGGDPKELVLQLDSPQLFSQPRRVVGGQARWRCVAVAAGQYPLEVVAHTQAGAPLVKTVTLNVRPASQTPGEGDGAGFLPPREVYARTYLLLPPGADSRWLEAVAASGIWDKQRWTIGGSADDAGIGPMRRRVIAVNPQRWGDDLQAFFDQHYPGLEYVAVYADSPQELQRSLSVM